MGSAPSVGRVGIPLGSTELGAGGLSPPPDVLTANPSVPLSTLGDDLPLSDDRNVSNERSGFRLLLSRSQTQGMRMRRKIVISASLLVAVLAIGGGLAATHRFPFERPAPPPAAVPIVPVVAGVVSSHDVPIYLRGVGTVIAYNTVVVRSQIQGQIIKIDFTEGQTVNAGDLLAQIDPRPYQAQLDQVTATRDRDQAQLANAQANLDRYTQLGEKGWATPQLVDTQKAQVAQLQSAIKADEALIEAAKVQLGYTSLTSPIDGVTGIRQVDIGNIIHPTDPNGLVVVTQIEPISVIFTLPETDLPQIQQQMAKGPLTVLAYSQDDTIKLDEGKLSSRRQRDPADDRHDPAQGGVSQHGASALAGRARQCAAAARYPARRPDRPGVGGAAGSSKAPTPM